MNSTLFPEAYKRAMKSFPSTPASKLLQEPKSPIQVAEAPSFAEIHTPTPLPASSRGSSVNMCCL